MEEIDKLFQLYESGNLPLVLQLCQAEGIDKRWFVRQLYDKYKTVYSPKHADIVSFAYQTIDWNIRFCCYYYPMSNDYSYWYETYNKYHEQTYDILDNILDKFLEIIENE